MTDDEHEKNNLPDVLVRWHGRDDTELERAPTEQSFCVSKADIAANDYDLSINRYREIVFEQIEYPAPRDILDELTTLEHEIQQGIELLKAKLT